MGTSAPKRPTAHAERARRKRSLTEDLSKQALPQRSSARLKGIKLDTENEISQAVSSNSGSPKDSSHTVRHGDLSLEELAADTLDEDEKRKLKESLNIKFEDDVTLQTPKTELENLLRTMRLRSYTRVAQKRIYSMIYHPTLEKDLVFTGDQAGNLGVWDATAEPEESQSQEGDILTGNAFSLQMHGAAIGCLRMDPISPERVYTSSYDSTLRVFSLSKHISMEVWRAPSTVQLGEFDILCSSSSASEMETPGSCHLDGRSLWLADHMGGLIHIDVRSASSEYHRWQVSDKKVGDLSVNPSVPHCIATASNDRSVRLFDTRMFGRSREVSIPMNRLSDDDFEDLNTLYASSQLGSMKREMACTSVSFSPKGDYLGTCKLLMYSQCMLR